MTDAEFLSYMTAAAEDRVLVSGAQVDRLRALAGIDVSKMPMPLTWWGVVCPDNVAWMVGRARRKAA